MHAVSRRSGAYPARSTLLDLQISSDGRAWLVISLLVIAEIVGVAGLIKSYEIAQTVRSNESEFTWFWFGMLMIEMPIIVGLISHSRPSGGARSALLILFGVVTFLPKLLRTPAGPDYHDEYAHWRATYNILSSGKLFEPAAIIPIITDYPGLHAATAAIVNFSGLDIWQSGNSLAHTLSPGSGARNRSAWSLGWIQLSCGRDCGNPVCRELFVSLLRYAVRVRVDGNYFANLEPGWRPAQAIYHPAGGGDYGLPPPCPAVRGYRHYASLVGVRPQSHHAAHIDYTERPAIGSPAGMEKDCGSGVWTNPDDDHGFRTVDLFRSAGDCFLPIFDTWGKACRS